MTDSYCMLLIRGSFNVKSTFLRLETFFSLSSHIHMLQCCLERLLRSICLRKDLFKAFTHGGFTESGDICLDLFLQLLASKKQ